MSAVNIVFKIDNVDFSGYLAEGGLEWKRNDLDAEGAGRDLNGNLMRARINSKVTLNCKTRPLNNAEVSNLLTALYPQSISVQYNDPQAGATLTKTMYCNNNPATCQRQYGDDLLWDGITFPLVEY